MSYMLELLNPVNHYRQMVSVMGPDYLLDSVAAVGMGMLCYGVFLWLAGHFNRGGTDAQPKRPG